ncbi:13624_t:CDS:2 [Ambispora gerdemannii]|uniref:13624_t:CDS:1 n=1 Tax=Ambispora gerdemannii TaxID=144530 RepID=A0A9N8VMR6_9GLOM|nr:13624_t:CDS:2 [Ambispora gerdemannii]
MSVFLVNNIPTSRTFPKTVFQEHLHIFLNIAASSTPFYGAARLRRLKFDNYIGSFYFKFPQGIYALKVYRAICPTLWSRDINATRNNRIRLHIDKSFNFKAAVLLPNLLELKNQQRFGEYSVSICMFFGYSPQQVKDVVEKPTRNDKKKEKQNSEMMKQETKKKVYKRGGAEEDGCLPSTKM